MNPLTLGELGQFGLAFHRQFLLKTRLTVLATLHLLSSRQL